MKSLFLGLLERLAIAEIDRAPASLWTAGHRFLRIDDFDSNGFYDWLRRADRQIIGVRYFIFREHEFIFGSFQNLEYITLGPLIDTGLEVRIYFGDERNFEPSISCDQLFNGDYFFRSENNVIGLTFQLRDSDELFDKSLLISAQL